MGKSKIKYYYGEDNLDYSINQENKLADEFERSMGINRDETVYKENPDLEVFNNVGNPSQYHEVEKRVGEYTINEQVIVEDNSTSSRMPVRDKITLTAILSGKELKLGREVFQGGSINTVLGGIEVDLREAIIREDIRVDVNVLLGGVDIRLPENVRCVVTTTDILGGVSVSKKFTKNQSEYAPTVYIGGSCVLGGIDIN